ncbi:MAG: diguanylate cyclase [Nitrospiria bacterium]
MDAVPQVLDAVDTGIVVFDRDFRVSHWNHWMATRTCLGRKEVLGRSLFDFYPRLKNRRFLRNCKSVFSFGNLAFFPQDPYRYLFPMKPLGLFQSEFEWMQQSCTIGPIRSEQGEITHLFVSVRDMTEVAAYQEKLLQLTRRDPLTGIFNRRLLKQFIEEELYRFKRYKRPFSVVMVDIDHFKEVNDQYGHLFGDEALKVIAAAMESCMRKVSRLARYGGEEFCCVLPETDANGAEALAEKLRSLIEALKFFSDQKPVKITASFGVVTVADDMDGFDAVLKMADQALYKAKSRGRNQVVIAP